MTRQKLQLSFHLSHYFLYPHQVKLDLIPTIETQHPGYIFLYSLDASRIVELQYFEYSVPVPARGPKNFRYQLPTCKEISLGSQFPQICQYLLVKKILGIKMDQILIFRSSEYLWFPTPTTNMQRNYFTVIISPNLSILIIGKEHFGHRRCIKY